MNLLLTPPTPLTSRQRLVLLITAAVVAISRLFAIQKTLWEWDEALFTQAMHDYDVVHHHPHPPGFPFYVLLARLIHLAGVSDYRSLQTVTVLAAIALFPLLFWLGREVRLSFRTALLGALLTVFFPNVWYHGGTAFSDVFGLAIAVAACAMLLRGCRDSRAYLLGALLLGLAAATRPQALFLGFAPAIISTWARWRVSRRSVFAATFIGAAVLVVAYFGAAVASQSVTDYVKILQVHHPYLHGDQSFVNQERGPLATLLDDFFAQPMPGGRIRFVVSGLAALGLIASMVRRDRSVWLVVAIFLPFNILGWLLVDLFSIYRYAIAWCAMYALLAAYGAGVIASSMKRFAPAIQIAVIIVIVVRCAWWAAPGLEEARSKPSPPAAAMEWLVRNVPPEAMIYANSSLLPFGDYYLSGRRVVWEDAAGSLGNAPVGADDYYVTEGISTVPGAHMFRREGRILEMVRPRYLAVSTSPASNRAVFRGGWYLLESAGTDWWRWTASRGEIVFPASESDRAKLQVALKIPVELIPRKPVLEIRVNGALIDRFVGTTEFITKRWDVAAVNNRPNVVEISIDKAVNPKKEGFFDDERDLGFQIYGYDFRPEREQLR